MLLTAARPPSRAPIAFMPAGLSAGLSAGLAAGLAAGLLCLSLSPGHAHGDHGGGGDGGVLPAGVTLVTAQYDYVNYKPISDARLTELAVAGVDGVHSLRSIAVPSLSVAYGLTRNFTVSARLPYLANTEIRETDVEGGGVTPRGGVYGWGDASVTGTYRFFQDASRGLEAAVIFGVKAPTGRTNVVDPFGVLFETEHQPGSGSWDGIIGGSLSRQMGLWSFGTNVLYTRAGAGSQDTRLGDRVSYGVTAGYRLWSSDGGHGEAMSLGLRPEGMMRHGGVSHTAEPATPPASIDVSLGVNGQWSGAQTVAGLTDGNTGGTVVYVTPGVRFTVDRWSSFVNVGIPVAQQLNGYQSDSRLQVTTGVSVRF